MNPVRFSGLAYGALRRQELVFSPSAALIWRGSGASLPHSNGRGDLEVWKFWLGDIAWELCATYQRVSGASPSRCEVLVRPFLVRFW